MGFDYGAARIGIAVGQSITGTATALCVVKNQKNGGHWQQIASLIEKWQPQQLVVGLPVSLNGKETSTTAKARDFAAALAQHHDLEIHFWDERLTSKEAERQFVEARKQGRAKRKNAQSLDAVAASLILQGWLQGRS